MDLKLKCPTCPNLTTKRVRGKPAPCQQCVDGHVREDEKLQEHRKSFRAGKSLSDILGRHLYTSTRDTSVPPPPRLSGADTQKAD